jgi:hypothetical protein
MSRRAFTPQTIYEAERPIRRAQSSFNQGMIVDGEARDIGNGAYAHAVRRLYNVRGYKDAIAGAPGSSLLSGGDFAATITDDLQTITQSFQSGGEVYVANGNSVPSVGDIIEVRGNGDFSGNQLTTAKGEAPRPYDYFEITSVSAGAESITYRGNLRIPALTGYGDTVATELTCSKLNTSITRVSGPEFSSALVGHYFVWPDGTRDRIEVYKNASELTVAKSGYYPETQYCKIQGRLYASWNFKLYNVLVVQSANRLYVSDGIPITGWKEIPIINTTRPSQIFGRFHEENQNLILSNGSGHYRIVFNEENVDPYAYKLNELIPVTFPTDIAPGSGLTNGYRITYCMSRIVAPSYHMDRTDALDGATLQHESGSLRYNQVSGVDYSEIWRSNAIGSTTAHVWEGFSPPATNHFTHYSLYRTKNINLNSLASGNQKELFVWLKDVPIAKAFICSRSETGVITATSGLFDPEDIGCVLTFPDSTTDIITGYISPTEAQGTVTASKSSTIAAIGGAFTNLFTISQTEKSITISGKSLSDSDVGKQIFVSNGKIIVITKVLTSTTATVHTSGTYTSLAGVMNPINRNINDTIDDTVLQTRIESGAALYFLQGRFFQPLPNTNLGVINGGQYCVAITGENRYYYCNTSKEQLVGYYHPEKMKNEKITDGIQQLRSYPGKIIIRCTNSTWALVTSTSAQGGDTSLGEQYSVIGDPESIADTIGVIGDTSSKTIANGQELVWTTEPAIRLFDGYQYGENLAENCVMSEVRKYMPDVKISYSPSDGIHFWGDQES